MSWTGWCACRRWVGADPLPSQRLESCRVVQPVVAVRRVGGEQRRSNSSGHERARDGLGREAAIGQLLQAVEASELRVLVSPDGHGQTGTVPGAGFGPLGVERDVVSAVPWLFPTPVPAAFPARAVHGVHRPLVGGRPSTSNSFWPEAQTRVSAQERTPPTIRVMVADPGLEATLVLTGPLARWIHERAKAEGRSEASLVAEAVALRWGRELSDAYRDLWVSSEALDQSKADAIVEAEVYRPRQARRREAG